MDNKKLIDDIAVSSGINIEKITDNGSDEIYIDVASDDLNKMCLSLHKILKSPVMTFFASDERKTKGAYILNAAFVGNEYKKWFFVRTRLDQNDPKFNSLSKDIHSASLFEREIKEMFGIESIGSPDTRRLNLHNEVWGKGSYPLRKDFVPAPGAAKDANGEFVFKKIEGKGVFEVPVGPVHAGIIGPGHFRFSVAGEPIINLEIRLGFTHRGAEKLFEGKDPSAAVKLAECVSGDSLFAHSEAFCRAIEKIQGINISKRAEYARAIFLELERMYNHLSGIGGMAIDVGFSFPSAFASIMKESMLALNHRLTGSRYLKGVNRIGGTAKELSKEDKALILASLAALRKDFEELKTMLYGSVSFMDRVDNTGVLRRKTAEDLGVIGPAARACGIPVDLRKYFSQSYKEAGFNLIKQDKGDALSRLNIRVKEFEESMRLIEFFITKLDEFPAQAAEDVRIKEGFGLGYAEGWRGSVLYWVKINKEGAIERCKIVDPSFHNWQGLSFAVLGNIIPDFPLCNKSFDLSYSGNDL